MEPPSPSQGAVLLLLLLARCLPLVTGSDTTQVIGLGASFPQEVFQSWASAFENYRQTFVRVNMR